jgi:hypothetical protein
LSSPAAFPFPEALERGRAVLNLIDEFGFLQAGALRGFEFVFQIAQFVGPAALVGYAGPEAAQGFAQAGMAVGDDEIRRHCAQAATPQVP